MRLWYCTNFGGEARLKELPQSSLEATDSVAKVRHKVRQGRPLTAEERGSLERDARSEHENGAHSSTRFSAESDFGRRGSGRTRSGFGTSLNLPRFPDGAHSPAVAERLERAASAVGGSRGGGSKGGGAAFRRERESPGPGEYKLDYGPSSSSFDGSGVQRLAASKSSPAFTMLSRIPMRRFTGPELIVPPVGTYFQGVL